MKLKIDEKDIGTIKVISQIAGGFTLLIALTMIFSLVQLKTINPLDNPSLLAVKEQFDKDQANVSKAEQVRAMDLMARKAYFASRSQVETGSYLLLAGAVIFLLCQRLISDNEKINPIFPKSKPDPVAIRKNSRVYLIGAGSIVTMTAIISSFVLRSDLPDLAGKKGSGSAGENTSVVKAEEPDKTNWPFFRGQDSRANAGGSGYPTEWNGEEGKNIEWKIELPKEGQSSPVIWEDKLFLTGADGSVCEVYCINKKNGDILWIGSASEVEGEPEVLPEVDQETGLAASTAATNGKQVCAVFANGNLVCFDMEGKLLWSKNLGVPANAYGYCSSLLIYGDLLLVQFDSEEKISIIGIDIATGDNKWETLRRGRAVWSSPVLAYFGGKPQVIINGNPEVTSFDAVTGEELWSVECLTGDVAPSLAVNGSMVFAVTDYARLAAIKPGAGASIVWEDNYFTPDVSSPVANDELLFVATGNGDIACYNSEKGDTLWTHYFTDQFYSSPVIADKKVYLLDRSGVMHIVKAEPKFELVAESPIGESTDGTPAFSDKKVFIKGRKFLYCISE